MAVCGLIMLFTVVITIKLMQSVRVSVSMGVMSGILMIGTSSYLSGLDYVGMGLILIGVSLLIKR
jgi:hypothetical protein